MPINPRVLRVAVPHHVYKSSQTGGTVGIDAFFWHSLDVEARLALLIRPEKLLAAQPREGYKRLWVRASPREQEDSLRRLRRGIGGWVKAHYRWKLARLVLPVREPRGGWEYEYAKQIVDGLGVLEYLDQVHWLNVEIRPGEPGAYIDGERDPLYTWLLENDSGFRMAVRRLAGALHRP